MMTGTVGLVELPQSEGWDPRTGPSITRRWRGSQTMVELGARDLQRAGIRYQIEPSLDGGYWILVGTYGAEETQSPDMPLSSVWSLIGNDLEKELWTKPSITTELNKIRDNEATLAVSAARAIPRLKALCEAIATGEDEGPDPVHTDVDLVPATIGQLEETCSYLQISAAVFTGYVESREDGVEAYSVSQWVLRHALILAANCTIRPSIINVGRVYSTAMLRAVEAIPATIMFDLPEGWWLKRSPTVEQTSADKFTLTQEYWHGDSYDPFVYEVAT